MAQYKVVCNKSDCWTRTYDDLEKAKIAATNHKKRFGHNPVYIYEIEEEYAYVSSELLAFKSKDTSKGILKIHSV